MGVVSESTVRIIFEGKDAVSGPIKAVMGNVQTLGSIALGAGAAVAGGIGAAGKALVDLAINAAPLETLSGAFEGLTQDMVGGSDAMLAALKDASSGMITSRDLMENFNKAAQLVSVDFAQKLPDAMKYLGKVAGATGQDMDYLMSSLITGVGRLSPMILDNLAIQVDATQAYEDYAKTLGKSATELTKTEQQTALMNQVLQKLAENTANMPDITESATAGLARFKATIQDVKDRLGIALLPILTDVLNKFGDMASKYLPVLVDFFETKVVPALSDLVHWLLNIDDPWNDFAANLKESAPLLGKIVNFIADVIVGIRGLWDILVKHDFTQRFVNIFGVAEDAPIVKFLLNLGDTFRKVFDFIKTILSKVKISDVLIAIGTAIASVVIPALIGIAQVVAPIIATFVGLVAAVALVRKAWETDWMGIRSTIVDIWENKIRPALETLWNFLTVTLPRAVGVFRDALGKGFTPLQALTSALLNIGVPSSVVTKIIKIVLAISKFAERAGQIIGKVITFISHNVKLGDVLIVVGGIIASIVIPALIGIAQAAAPVVAILIGLIGAVALIRRAWETDFLGIRTTLTDLWNNTIVPTFNEVKEILAEKLPEAGGKLKDFWENTLQPAIAKVGEWIETKLIPFLAEVVAWYISHIPDAIRFLISVWEGILLPAITTVWEFITTKLIPTFMNIYDWLAKNIPLAIAFVKNIWETVFVPAINTVIAIIQFLASIWTNILWPAIQLVMGFVTGTVIPIFTTMARLFTAVVGLAIRTVANYFNNTLMPALKKIWEEITRRVKPIFEKLSDVWNQHILPVIKSIADKIYERLAPAFRTAKSVTDTLKDALNKAITIFNNVRNAIQRIIDKVQRLIDWVNDLIDTINNIPAINIGGGGSEPEVAPMTAPLAAPLAAAAMGAVGVGAGNTYNTYNTYTFNVTGADTRDIVGSFERLRALTTARRAY